jgi:DNA-directed RNA polymerase subunit RPC12/RpoP
MNQDNIASAVGVVVLILYIGFIFFLFVVRHRQKNYIKGVCPECDNPIEFPKRGLGMVIECPHCQNQILLRESLSPKKLPWLIGLPVFLVKRYLKNRNAQYIQSFCPDCDNPIEFPASGIGQTIECPHCQSQIVLCRTAPKEKPQRTHWLKPSHVIAIVCVLLLCGTALYVYQDSKAQQLRESVESSGPSRRERIEQAHAEFYKNREAKRQAAIQQSAQDAAVDELRRANNIAVDELRRANNIADQQRQIMADAEFNQRMQSLEQSFEQSEQNRKVINEIQEIGHDNRMKAINEQYQPQNQPWILKFNSFENRWQYAPPNAQLKYNALANRWEFVP